MNKCLFLALLLPLAALHGAETVWLTSLDLAKMTSGWGQAQKDKAVTGQPLSIGGKAFQHGVGTHANSSLWIHLGRGSEQFLANVGVDDAANGPSALIFRITGDGKKLFESGPIAKGDAAREVVVDVHGVETLLIQALAGGTSVDFCHADWAEARFVTTGTAPVATDAPSRQEPFLILTPKPGPAPRINGPTITGARPGHPFLFRIPTTGQRPIQFAATKLPAGLVLDPGTGIISGTTPPAGSYKIALRAKNPHGAARRELRLVSGDTLALTPTMGWNHWYAHYNRVTDKMVREAADVMVRSGMADVGYQYVSIDDCWMNAPRSDDPLRMGPLRDANGRIIPNRHFPDMPALTEHIHAQGLKAGIYTSPGPFTCGGFAGSYQFEAIDAATFARWGFDLLKYDWCSFGDIAKVDPRSDAEKFRHPYQLMGGLLRQQPRDIVLNLCQYGMGDVWEWGAEVGGQSWRTSGDLGFELDRIFEVALNNAKHGSFQRPGAWNDPDYIQIGYIGAAQAMGEPKPCGMPPGEQYAYMSLWSLMASPLFYSGDMSRLDAFTLNVLCNPEVIDVNQDALGQCARVIPVRDNTFVMVKPLEDRSVAVGLFNRGELPAQVTAQWNDLGVTGKQRVRDLWRQKELGRFSGSFGATVGPRGVVLVRLRR